MRSSSDTRHWPEDEGLAARATTVAAAMIGAAVVGGVASSQASKGAAEDAANAQRDSTQQGIAAQNQQFEAMRELLSPWVKAGGRALAGQQDLAGLNGAAPQQMAIDALQQSPQFQSLLRQGESSILSNASATGGLRGGNTQAALAQFSPQLLAQTIENQYGRLGGLSSVGQNAAAGVGNAGMANGAGVSALLQQQGAASAGAALAGGRAAGQAYSSIANGIGTYAGMGGFNSVGNAGYGDYKGFYDNGGGGF
jgi:hypothetical protein